MGFRRLNYDLRNLIGVHLHKHKRIFIWLFICVLIGICFGLSTVFSASFKFDKISKHLIDQNIWNSVTVNSKVFSFITARIFDFLACALFVFIVSLHSWTVLLVFPFIAFKGFWLVLNIYWIGAKFGIFAGSVLLISYLFWLIVLLVIFITAAVWIMARCAELRCFGFKQGADWKEFFRCSCIFLCVIASVAVLEWLLYWTVLSKMVFIV